MRFLKAFRLLVVLIALVVAFGFYSTFKVNRFCGAIAPATSIEQIRQSVSQQGLRLVGPTQSEGAVESKAIIYGNGGFPCTCVLSLASGSLVQSRWRCL